MTQKKKVTKKVEVKKPVAKPVCKDNCKCTVTSIKKKSFWSRIFG